MSDQIGTPLKWTTQLNVTKSVSRLQGDKILLPQSALEQLLSAATTTVTPNAPSHTYTSTFDPFNPYSFAAENQARSYFQERHQHLPHPLTFRLVNPENGNIAFAGVREFSAADGEIGLSPYLRQALGIGEAKETFNGNEIAKITVHAQQLPKGTYVRFRPLEAGYDPEDWKSLLEHYMRDTFTTLTKGEILGISAGKEEFQFLVDKIEPEGEAICIIDTDLEADIEALNEEQARETLKKRLQKSEKVVQGKEDTSVGGILTIGKIETGQIQAGSHVDYIVRNWDRSKDVNIELDCEDSEHPLDLLVSPLTPKQRARPREDEYVLGDLSERPSKRLRINKMNTELEGAEALYVSIHAYNVKENTDPLEQTRLVPYSLRISVDDALTNSKGSDAKVIDEEPQNNDEVRCHNCYQMVPKRTLFLHENFCLRNNVLCPKCKEVFQKSSSEWRNHWHCSHDDTHGNYPSLQHKHNDLYHTPRSCPSCDYEAQNIPDLAHHRTTTCPGKLILCQFCHLLVPQQGPDDPSPSDPEVVLSGLTPHELSDGARTTECHLCGKITRLRDMATHLKHHDLERLSRSAPRICRNVNCGRTHDGVGPNGEIKRPQPSRNDLDLCDVCFGPLYNSSFDPEGKALRRRVERRYLTQFLTGCGKDWCRNEFCKTGRKYFGAERPEQVVGSKEAMALTKPIIEKFKNQESPLHFCTDEASQKRRVLAEMIAAEDGSDGDGSGRQRTGYDLRWCIAALEAENGDLGKATAWLGNWAPTRAEAARR